jgi:hypothetical protein
MDIFLAIFRIPVNYYFVLLTESKILLMQASAGSKK